MGQDDIRNGMIPDIWNRMIPSMGRDGMGWDEMGGGGRGWMWWDRTIHGIGQGGMLYGMGWDGVGWLWDEIGRTAMEYGVNAMEMGRNGTGRGETDGVGCDGVIHGLERDGMEWDGMRWDVMGPDGTAYNNIWDGMGRDGK